jgi:outer membrane receptor protein involved in Fe transport
MKNSIVSILLLFVMTPIIAQNTISGKVTDDFKTPLPSANIILQQKGNDGFVQGVVSDDDGAYIFEDIEDGTYWIEVSVLGFKVKKTEEFELLKNKITDFFLEEEVQSLNEVVVKSKRPIIRQTAEKLVVDLENSEMINTSLQDVMRKVPGVLVTNNGISIAGNRGVRILINGRTTEYMDVQALLRDFPADNIAKIEVVEQPGAEYEASGSGAIINIILKKNVRLGTHGNLNTWVGEDEGFEYGTGVSIASYKNKLNWQGSINHSRPTWREDLFLVRTVGNQTYNQATIEPYNPSNLSISGNFDFYINTKNIFGVGGRYNTRTSNRIASSKTVVSDPTSSNVLLSENNFDIDRFDFNFNPYYEYKSDSDKLLVDFNYINFKNDNTNTLSDVPGSNIPFINRKYNQEGKYTIKTYRLDYTKTFSDELSLSLGTRYSDVSTDNDLQSFSETTSSFFQFNENESSQFLIDETVLALYSKANATFGKWSFSGGVRYEDSNTDGNSIFMKNGTLVSSVKKRPIKKVFPSASISREISEVLGANVSYSYRIRRPSYGSLNSFTEFLDPYSASQGNPNLTPSYINKYQFNLTYEGQPFFAIGYSDTEDAIFELIQQDNIDDPAQIRKMEVNIENNANWNFRLFGPLSFIKGVDGFTGFIVINTDYESSTYSIDLNKWSLIWFTQASYELPYEINFEVNGNYGTGALEQGVEVSWLADLSFSFGKKFFDDQLKVNLGFSKILNRGFVGVIDYGNVNASVESNGSRQNVQLRLAYNFGSKFGKSKTDRNSTQEEDRIQDEN